MKVVIKQKDRETDELKQVRTYCIEGDSSLDM